MGGMRWWARRGGIERGDRVEGEVFQSGKSNGTAAAFFGVVAVAAGDGLVGGARGRTRRRA